jgi:hypothetical protein
MIGSLPTWRGTRSVLSIRERFFRLVSPNRCFLVHSSTRSNYVIDNELDLSVFHDSEFHLDDG